MDKKDFVAKCLRWQELQEEAAAIAAELEAETLTLGKTQTVGDVRVTFSNPLKKYDHQDAAEGHPMVSEATISLFTTQPEPYVDWRAICKHAGITVEGVVPEGKKPTAKIKLLT